MGIKMRRLKSFIILLATILLLTGCGKKYIGYWCNYDEAAVITVLMKDGYTENDKTKIEKVLNDYENIDSINFISKEDYAAQMGQSPEDIDIYANFIVSFDSVDNIGTYVEELSKMSGVLEAKQSFAKTGITIYNLEKGHKYTYTNSDEATDNDKVTGKYQEKNGVITLTPDDGGKTTLLYIKDKYLCADADCQEIFTSSDEKCSSK
jgi:hypothetical protein